MIRLRRNSQREAPVATGFECRFPGSLVLFGDDVVVQLPEQREQRRPELTQRWRGIAEVQASNTLPLRMIWGSGETTVGPEAPKARSFLRGEQQRPLRHCPRSHAQPLVAKASPGLIESLYHEFCALYRARVTRRLAKWPPDPSPTQSPRDP